MSYVCAVDGGSEGVVVQEDTGTLRLARETSGSHESSTMAVVASIRASRWQPVGAGTVYLSSPAWRLDA